MPESPEAPRRSPRRAVNHQCPHCDKAYERQEHLVRHLGSHRNERVYKCPMCQRGFNRRDVLQRHQAVHEKDEARGKASLRRTKERAIEACEACATAKLSCDNERPCKRCHSKRINCVPRPKSRRLSRERLSYSVSLPPYSPQVGESPPGLSTLTPAPESGLLESFPGNVHERYDADVAQTSELILETVIPDTDAQAYLPMNGFPAFFEQVMLPVVDADDAVHDTQQPRVFDFMQDTDFTFLDTDIFGTNFIPDLDKALDVPMAFTELWVPEKNQHAFSEERQIPLRDTDSIPTSYQNRLDAVRIPGKLSYQARDDILKLVIRTGGSRLSVTTFPSPDYLDTLIKIGIGKRTETDAWIHPYTFYDSDYQQLRPELLTALIAAGCVCCGMPSINKTGIILQEITRVSLAQLVEDDNSVLRDLQYLQASMMWLDIGIFCGYTRKMQIAESYLQPLCTAVRRGAAFDRSTYTVITPYSFGNDNESLKRAWHAWVRQESLKRLVYHLFGHDVEVATTMNRPAIISYTELTVPFPSTRGLWFAPSAESWRDIWIAYQLTGCSELNLRDLLSDPSLMTQLAPELDIEVARSALLQGLALQVWECRQQMLLSQTSLSGPRATTQLWLQSRQEDLYTTLRAVQQDSLSVPPVTTLMSEFVMMYLHIDIDAIQRFVGRMGELDARRAYPGLRDWSRTKEARFAIWHAGQMFRAARNVAAYQFRGFESLAIYHATLVLWVYGLIQCGETKRLEVTTPMSEADLTAPVPLDEPENQVTKSFLSHGVGRPGLMMLQPRGKNEQDVKVFYELAKPCAVTAVAQQVFEGNCRLPFSDVLLPPIIQNLCALIKDLGNLQ
ncbi:hypothetical protein AFLA70_116g002921 [Aspergillus flavus AF70]|nr:hypothetical protein AFLA70_116g002921 [Aspergillus flavus AF70]